jgi:hypothetical protein
MKCDENIKDFLKGGGIRLDEGKEAGASVKRDLERTNRHASQIKTVLFLDVTRPRKTSSIPRCGASDPLVKESSL